MGKLEGLVLIRLCWIRNVLNVALKCVGLGRNWALLFVLSSGPCLPHSNYYLVIGRPLQLRQGRMRCGSEGMIYWLQGSRKACEIAGGFSLSGKSSWELSVWWLRQGFCLVSVMGFADMWGFLFFPQGGGCSWMLLLFSLKAGRGRSRGRVA